MVLDHVDHRPVEVRIVEHGGGNEQATLRRRHPWQHTAILRSFSDQVAPGFNACEGHSPSPSDPHRRGAPDGQQSLPILDLWGHSRASSSATTPLHEHSTWCMIMRSWFVSGIIGASGYTGAELLRLLAGHPEMDLVVATADRNAGGAAADLYPSLAASYPGLLFEPFDVDRVADLGLDVAFLGLPHEASMALVPAARPARSGASSTCRRHSGCRDASLYPRWYGFEHDQPELLAERGLRTARAHAQGAARRVADRDARLLRHSRHAGAGTAARCWFDRAHGHHRRRGERRLRRRPRADGRRTRSARSTRTSPPTACSNHRHTPEIEQNLDAPEQTSTVLFTPHLAPMSRGILATCYARPAGECRRVQRLVARRLREGVRRRAVRGRHAGSPSTKATLGSNSAHVTVRVRRTHRLRRGDLRDRQPHQGRFWRGAAGRQRRARTRRDRRAPARRGHAVRPVR